MAGRAQLNREGHHVLLAATGGGNIGDQAMLESFMQNSTGPLAIITSDVRSLKIPEGHISRVAVHEIPDLVKGLPVLRLGATRRLIHLLRGAKSYSVIGADIMDGVYSPEQSVARMSSINCALIMGVDARILGFSWSPNAGHSAKSAMRRLNCGARIYARDPRSLDRLKQDGVTNAQLVADTVFSLDAHQDVPVLKSWIESRKESGRRIAIVNISGLISRDVDLSKDYLEIIEHLIASNYSVLLLPHVIRRGDDDSNAIANLANSLPKADENIHRVDYLLEPGQVKALVSHVDVVVTGRMHLAVISLSAGVPTITFGTQGKVEGLYALVHLASFCVAPQAGVGVRCIELLNTIDRDRLQICSSISNALPEILNSSKRNFDALRRD